MASYAAQLLQALLALAAVCLLAVVALRAAARRGWGTGAGKGPVRVLQRIPLEQRRALYLVKAGNRTLLIGVGEGGGPALLAELDEKQLGDELNSLATGGRDGAEPKAEPGGEG
jgi:flagellar protein FliO/FliZ